MDERISGEAFERSSFFDGARRRAAEYLRNPGKLNRLLDRVSSEIRGRRGPLAEFTDSLKTCLRLLRAYADGRYREIPARSLVALVAWLIYFVMPVDSIPDFILGLGLADDAVLLGWVLSSMRTDLDRFAAWESRAGDTPAESVTGPR